MSEGIRVTISSDGTPEGSSALIDRGPRNEMVKDGITHASCSVHTYPDGRRMITATVWVDSSKKASVSA